MPRLAPRWRKVLRDLLRHKARTLLVVLAIAVGILGAGTVLDAWSLVRGATRGQYRASNPASATLETGPLDAALLERIRALPAIRDAQLRATAAGSARVEEGWRPLLLFAFDDYAAIRIGRVKPEAGAWPPRDGELIVEASSAAFANAGIGASLLVQMPEREARGLAVAGIARDVGLAPGWMEHVVYGFVTRGTLRELQATPVEQLQIVVADRTQGREDVRRIALEVRGVVESAGGTVAKVDVPVPGRHVHAAQIDSLLFTQGAFGVLSLLLSGVLVVNLIAAMLVGQVREIGVMKALGASSAQIAALYLFAALVLGLLASALAIPLAMVLGRLYAGFTAELLNFDVAGFTIPPGVLLAQLLVGTLLPLLAASIPLLRGCRIPVCKALSDVGIEGAARTRRFARMGGLSRPILLSLDNAFRRRQRMLLTLLTLALGGAVFVAALDLRAAIRASVDLLFDTGRYDLALRLVRPAAPEVLEDVLARLPGVAHSEAWGTARAAIPEADGRQGGGFVISAPPAASRMFAPHLESGRLPAPGEERALLVSRRLLADEPRLALDATLELALAGELASWTVVGVVDAGPIPAAYTWRETLSRVTGRSETDRLVVASSLPPSSPRLALVRSVRAELESRGMTVQTSQLVEDSRRVLEDHLLLVASFLGVMAQLMLVVGGLGLGSTMSLGVLERTREIGVLRAIGARHRSILTLVMVEGLVVGLTSFVVALPLSLPMSLVLGWAFGRIMFSVPVLILPRASAVVTWLLVVIVVSILASAWPAWRAARIPTAAALAYE